MSICYDNLDERTKIMLTLTNSNTSQDMLKKYGLYFLESLRWFEVSSEFNQIRLCSEESGVVRSVVHLMYWIQIELPCLKRFEALYLDFETCDFFFKFVNR